MRQYQIRDHSEDEAYHLINDVFWPVVREILGPWISEHFRAAGGPRSVFFRMDSPELLLTPPLDSEASRLRRSIVAKARELAQT